MPKKTVLSTNTIKLLPTSSSQENHSPPPSAEIIATNVDLLTEILLRIPARSLIKFKSVSKRWLSLISDSRFARHHANQNPSPLPSGLYFHTTRNRWLPLSDQITRVSVRNHPRTTLPDFSFLGDHSGSGSATTVDRSSNGLMLCSTFDTYNCIDKNYVICNLTTQKSLVLPTPVLSEFHLKFKSYLVFDPKKSPYYKVVMVSLANCDLNTYQLHVYSSESASWKSPILALKIQYESYERAGVHGAVWNGELILMTCDRDHDHFYMGFDIDEEKLTTTRVPYLDSNISERIEYFEECTGHLLLIQCSWYDPKEFKVLEVIDGENHFRWNVKYVVDLTPSRLTSRRRLTSRSCGTFLVMSVMNVGANENELAVVVYNWGKVIQYNIERKTWKVLCDFPGGGFSAAVRPLYEDTFCFIESLTPV